MPSEEMHDIEPYYGWQKFYDTSMDELSPYFGKIYNYDLYRETIYDYYIDPGWDTIGSETLYIKILFVEYNRGFAILEFIGEWNDAINNDIMNLKRNIIEILQNNGINKFILIGENVMNYHGSDDCYYEEWFDEVSDIDHYEKTGWIAAINFRGHIIDEWENFSLNQYIYCDVNFRIFDWRTMLPFSFFKKVEKLIEYRIESA